MTMIIKQEDGRLYCTETKCFIEQIDITEMVRSSRVFKVVSSVDGRDVTADVLHSILMGGESGRGSQLDPEFLKVMIREGDGSFSGWIEQKVNAEFDRELEQEPALNKVAV